LVKAKEGTILCSRTKGQKEPTVEGLLKEKRKNEKNFRGQPRPPSFVRRRGGKDEIRGVKRGKPAL